MSSKVLPCRIIYVLSNQFTFKDLTQKLVYGPEKVSKSQIAIWSPPSPRKDNLVFQRRYHVVVGN